MFNTELVKQAKRDNKNAQKIIGELYSDNVKLFYVMAKDLGVEYNDLDDFMQNCYFALSKTIETWEEGGASFLSYLRVNVKFYNFRERLKMKYPVKLHTQNYKNPPSYSQDDVLKYSVDSSAEVRLREAEDNVLRSAIWSTAKEILNEREYIVIYGRYCYNCTLRKLSEYLKVSVETVRRTEKSAINKLKSSNTFTMKFYDV